MKHPIIYRPIGIIRSGHAEAELAPAQPAYAAGCKGQAEIFHRFAGGLHGLEGFLYIYLIYHFNKAGCSGPYPKQLRKNAVKGIFSTRDPQRPNAVGISIVKLLCRKKNILFLDDVDILDGTPLLDIKPYYYTSWRNHKAPSRQVGNTPRNFTDKMGLPINRKLRTL